MTSRRHPKPTPKPEPVRDAGAKTRKRSHRKSTRKRREREQRAVKVVDEIAIVVSALEGETTLSCAWNEQTYLEITRKSEHGTAVMVLKFNEAGEIVIFDSELRALPGND